MKDSQKVRVDLVQELASLLTYNPDTGEMFWKNGRKAGRIVCGYRDIVFKHIAFKAHRVIWYMVHGKYPAENEQIDHINQCRSDNRLVNLRLCDQFTNQHNRFNNPKQKLLGAFYHKGVKKYQASITLNNKDIYLGLFDTEQEAHEKYMEAKRIYHADAYIGKQAV